MSERDELIAQLEASALMQMPKQNGSRLAYEIAIGIWLGGMALGISWGLIGLLLMKAAVDGLKIG